MLCITKTGYDGKKNQNYSVINIIVIGKNLSNKLGVHIF